MFGTRGKAKACNFVHNDEIWKDHVNRELLSQRRWPETWGFLAKEYQNLQMKTLQIGRDADSGPKAEVSPHTEEETGKKKVTEKTAAPAKFPQTTSHMIGWKVRSGTLHATRIERHARGKSDIVKAFRWPREGL